MSHKKIWNSLDIHEKLDLFDCQLKLHVIYFQPNTFIVIAGWNIWLVVCCFTVENRAAGQLWIKPQKANQWNDISNTASVMFIQMFYFSAWLALGWYWFSHLWLEFQMGIEINRPWFVEPECEFNNRMSYDLDGKWHQNLSSHKHLFIQSTLHMQNEEIEVQAQ